MSTNEGLDADEVVDAVSRRAELIESLIDGPKYNRDIREQLDVSRSTAYKAIHELEEHHLAHRGDEGYELTLTGRLLFEAYRGFRDHVEDICRPGQLLSILPEDVDITIDLLDGAEVYFAERHAPYRPVHAVEEVVRDASVVKGTGPVVLPSYVELFYELLVAGELEAELVFEQPAFEHLATDYADDYVEAFETERLEVWSIDDELPFGLLVVEEPEERVGIIVYDRGGELRGFIENDTGRAYEWGCNLWERFRAQATRITEDPGKRSVDESSGAGG